MLKKTIDMKVAGLRVNCGTCIHHKKLPLYSNKPCIEHGVEEYALAPNCYKTDVLKLVEGTPPEFVAHLGRGLKDLAPETVLALAYTMATSASLVRKTGLQFGQPVYFSLGGDYVTHYFKGYVVSCNDDGTINIASRLNAATENTLLRLLGESLLMKSQWRKKLEILVASNRIKLDRTEKERRSWVAEILSYEGTIEIDRSKKVLIDYEPPTLDTAPETLIELAKQTTSKKSKTPKKPPRVRGFDLKTRTIEDGPEESVSFVTETGFQTEGAEE